MRRRIAIIAGLLILGAIVNVAVVVLAIVWPQGAVSAREIVFSSDDDSGWRMGHDRGRAYDRLVFFRRTPGPEFFLAQRRPQPGPPSTMVPRWSRMTQPEHSRPESYFTFFLEDARGWPMLCMSSLTSDSLDDLRAFPPRNAIATDGIVVDEQIAISSNLRTVQILPLRPMWGGFIINAVFYAALLWLLVFAPFRVRRAMRRKRRLCEKCAYPIGVSPVCTECGAALRRS